MRRRRQRPKLLDEFCRQLAGGADRAAAAVQQPHPLAEFYRQCARSMTPAQRAQVAASLREAAAALAEMMRVLAEKVAGGPPLVGAYPLHVRAERLDPVAEMPPDLRRRVTEGEAKRPGCGEAT
jgi:hypothetical protein